MINSRNINDLEPAAKTACLAHIAACEALGIKTKLIQTLRDAEYQKSLYNQGRTAPGKIVTNCDGYRKRSKHQSGLAWDLVPLDENGAILWSDRDVYEKMAEAAERLHITAGLRWNSLGDMDHFQVDA